MNYSDKFTPKEISVFNEIFDLLDSLYHLENANIKELDKLYRKFIDSLVEYGTDTSFEESLNEDVKITSMTLTEFLNEFDFGVHKMRDESGEIIYKLEDFQKANLGNIEDEKFYDIECILDRLDIYYEDYLLDDIEFQLDELAQIIGDKSIETKWYDLGDYKDMYDYLHDIQETYCQDDNSSVDFTYVLGYLYYIVNPDKLVDDTEIEE